MYPPISRSQIPSEPSRKIATTGFAIENIDQFLPNFNNQPLLLGWLFKFAGPNNEQKPRNKYEITGIVIEEVCLVRESGNYRMETKELKTTSGVSPTIVPVIHLQEADPVQTDLANPYSTLLATTQSEYYKLDTLGNPALILEMEEYKCWVEATFIRATDLRLLKTYLQNSTSSYQDVFFSGAQLNYSNMHNARLRVEQHWLPLTSDCADLVNNDPESGTVQKIGTKDYLRTSKSFTLKAEPIVVSNSLPTKGGSDGTSSGPIQEDGGLNQDDSSGDSQPENSPPQGVNGMLPSSFIMVSCPKVWDVMRAISEEASIATAKVFTYPLGDSVPESLDAMLKTLGGSLPTVLSNLPTPSGQTSGTALANFLRALADWIDSLFTSGNSTS